MTQTCRLYDDAFRLLGEWPYQVPPDELTPGRHVVIDRPGGTRWSGTVTEAEGLVHDIELLATVAAWRNPFLSSAEPTEES